ncbi:unnamed protein product, partial [Phaeothamnion confervicola]
MVIPPVFKKLTSYIRRAEELDRDTTRGECRLVAYYCRTFAMEQGIKMADQSPAGKQFLLQLMDQLENEKKAISGFTEEEGKMVVTSFANDVFSRADDEDRAGLADKGTASSFFAAATFYDILEQFPGGIPEETVQKRKYARWKTAQILK